AARSAPRGVQPGAASAAVGRVPSLSDGRSPRLAVPRMPAAPAAVLAQLDPVRVVALGFLGLVVAPPALVAGQRHGNSDVSAGHGSSLMGNVLAQRRKTSAG